MGPNPRDFEHPGGRERGVITRLLRGAALQISPPFVITEAEIARIAEVFGAAFDAVAVNR
jgi:adenosylmethionine-8-amino-7-oxononanoate aminotransferase